MTPFESKHLQLETTAVELSAWRKFQSAHGCILNPLRHLGAASCLSIVALALAVACKSGHGHHHADTAPSSAQEVIAPATVAPSPNTEPDRIERKERAMGTNVDIIAYTNDTIDLEQAHAAIDQALQEIERLEAELSEWRESSDIGRVNHSDGTWVNVSPESDSFATLELDYGWDLNAHWV